MVDFKILEEEKTPEQWKVARILPLFKKGDKEKTENYRPISNLYSITKVYEKPLLHWFQKIQEKENVDLTDNSKHGFKKNFSTESACLEIQTKLSNACDSGGFAALASLDLTAAFDVVDRNLLRKRLKIMGIPVQLIHLLDDWLSDRSADCEVNKNNSEFLDINFGTIQGSILCSLLFALFISPLADITTPTTYANDNYLFGSGETEKKALENCIKESEIAMKWFLDSGLCVNKKKTEVCVFH